MTLSPSCTTVTAPLRFPSHASSLSPAPPSASLPPTRLYRSSASFKSLQAYTHCQLLLLLSHCDLTREHSRPATIPPRTLFCLRPALSSSATTLPPFHFLFLRAAFLFSSRSHPCRQWVPPPTISVHKRGSHPLLRETPPPPPIATLLKSKVPMRPMTPGSAASGALVPSKIACRKKMVPGELPYKILVVQ